MAHTTGPFIAWDDGRTIGIETEHGPIAVAEIVDHGDMADEAQLLADQRLFAASDDMLAALKAIAGLESRTKADCIGLLKRARHIAKCTIAQIDGGAA